MMRALLALLLVALLLPRTALAQTPADWDTPGGHFFTQTGGGTGRGYEVSDAGGVRFWSEFQRFGGVQAVGYPASQRFQWDGFTVQVFQRVVFQWRPEVQQAYFVNVFDRLHDLGKDEFLMRVRQTPPPRPFPDAGKPFDQVTREHLAVMDAYPAIRAKYFAVVGDPVQANGLPVSDVVDQGNHYALRAQRVVLQQWKQDVPWARAGEVTVALGGDIAKEAGVLPDPAALQPVPPPVAQSQPTPSPAALASGWSTAADMPTARRELGVAAANGRIYAIGGRNESSLLDTVEEYDPVTNSWRMRQPMPTRRAALAVTAHTNGRIYAIGGVEGTLGSIPIGGCNPAGYSAKVEEFDPATNSWQTRAPMPGPRGNLAAASLNGRIYVLGGQAGCYHGYGGTALEFDPAANGGMGSWTQHTDWPRGGVGSGAASVGGRLYLLGGYALSGFGRSVFDGTTNSWGSLPSPIPTPNSHLGLVAHPNGRVYAIGGFTGGISGSPPTILDLVQEWDPAANGGAGGWTLRQPMPLGPRWGLGAATVGSAIYAIGGAPVASGNPVLGRVERFVP